MFVRPLSSFVRLPALAPDGDGGGSGGGDGSAGTPAAAAGTAPNANPGGNGGTDAATAPKAEALTIVVEGKTYLLQDHANRLVGDARKEGRTTAETEAQRRADEAAAKARGDFEKLANDRQAEIDRLNGELAARDRGALRAKVIADHRLPAHWADRLRGESEAELVADAKQMAKDLKPPAAPNTEAGAGGRGGKGGDPPKPTIPTATYFPEGAVPIPTS